MERINMKLTRPIVEKISLPALLAMKVVRPDKLRLDCEIVSITRFKASSKPKRRGNWNNYSQPYSRLVLCREVDSGRAFYIRTISDAESLKLFAKKSTYFIGMYFTIYEPLDGKSDIYGVPVLKPSNPFIPIDPSFIGMKVTGLPVTLSEDVTVVTFFERCLDLQLTGVSIQEACPAQACNGSHLKEQAAACPAVKSVSKLSAFTLSVYVTSELLEMSGEFSSTSLGLLFFEEDSFNDKLDQDVVATVVQEGLQHYADAGVAFLLAGRHKAHLDEEEVAAQINKLYFSSVRPQRILADLLKYRLPAPVVEAGVGSALGSINLGPSRQQFLQ